MKTKHSLLVLVSLVAMLYGTPSLAVGLCNPDYWQCYQITFITDSGSGYKNGEQLRYRSSNVTEPLFFDITGINPFVAGLGSNMSTPQPLMAAGNILLILDSDPNNVQCTLSVFVGSKLVGGWQRKSALFDIYPTGDCKRVTMGAPWKMVRNFDHDVAYFEVYLKVEK